MIRFCLLALLTATAFAQSVDILIQGGQLIDGTGAAEARAADVGLQGDRIVFIGDAAKAKIKAARTIDAKGLIVSPGFIDPHAHVFEDLSDSRRKTNENYLRQGVTTVVAGNDGAGPFNVKTAIDKWKSAGIGTNAVLLVGYGSVRREVLGMSAKAPTPAQLDAMRGLVKKAMDEGAFGLSTGLFYTPQNFGTTEEVIELAKVAAKYGGIYDSHMRDEGNYSIGLLGALEETIRIGRESGIRVHVSHIKALGVDMWGKSKDAIALVRKARAAGVRITADQYPYSASGSSLHASLLPPWSQEGGQARLIERLDDPAQRVKIEAETAENMRRRGGEDSFLLLSPRDTTIRNKRLGEVAKTWKVTPVEAALRIIRNGGSGVASFNMSEDDIEAFMKEDWVMTCSDGSFGHPRKYGTFPRKIRKYVMERKVIPLHTAIHRSSGLTADTFQIANRGRIVSGAFADVIVFDPKTIRDVSTYEEPEKLAEGMRWVFVNGRAAIDDGKYTGVLEGKALSRLNASQP
jgi:N-acyl-D-aspartate/D-glutamate deacylase